MRIINYNPDMVITRWTSPTIIVELEEGLNADDIYRFSLSCYQKGKQMFDKTVPTKVDDSHVSVKLTVNDTQKLDAIERPKTQVRYRMKNDDQYATDIFEFVVQDVLKDGAI